VNQRLLSVGVVAAVLAAGIGAGLLTLPDADRADGQTGERRIAVRNSVAVCPDPTTNGLTQARVAAAVPPAGRLPATVPDGTDDAAGQATLSDLTRPRSVRQRLSKTGTTASLALNDVSVGPLVGRARGELAPGYTVQQTARTTAGRGRGVSSAICAAPGTGFWFIGTSTGPRRQSTLYLTNSEQVTATVEVFLYGPKGRIEAPGGRNLQIRAGRQRTELLGALAPGVTDLTVNVVVRTGRVAAAVHDQEVVGGDGRGVDWVPAAARPARRVLVPPSPAGTVQRLYLLAPGEDDGTAKVRMIAKDGSFTPVGAETIPLTSGRVASVDISKASRGEPVAVSIDSEVPVVAGMRVIRGAGTGDIPDVAYLAGTAPIVNGAVVPDSRGGSDAARLYLTASGREARATVTTMAATGSPRSEDVTVPADTTVTVTLRSPSPRVTGYAVVVRPAEGSGDLYGSWAQFVAAPDGEMFTGAPLVDNGATVVVPLVGHDLSAGISRTK
jgi:hypothetical protein